MFLKIVFYFLLLHVVQLFISLSHIWVFVIPWTAAHQVSLSITNSWSLLKLQEAWMVGDAIQPSHPLSSPSPPVLNLSQHHGLFLTNQFFASGGQSIGVSASASVLPMNIQDWFPSGLTGLISLQVRGTHKSLLQHHSTKASILQCSAFFMAQLSHHTWLLEKP